MHHRLSPKEHRFSHHIFMFYLDLDELDVTDAAARVQVSVDADDTGGPGPATGIASTRRCSIPRNG